MPKKIEWGDPLGFLNIYFVAKLQKIERDPLGNFFSEKSPAMPKKTETLWSRPVLYVTRETFLVQFIEPRGTIWRLLKIL